MSKFDNQLWKERAWARYSRASASLRSRQKTAVAEAFGVWNVDNRAIEDLSCVVAWCQEKRIDVDFVKKPLGTYHCAEKKISISARLNPLKQLVVLLHECGHYLIGHDEDHERFGMGYPQSEPEVTRTFHHRLTCLEEELEAWHRGWKLAQRLGLALKREEFDEVRLECIRSYVKWTLRPSGIKAGETQ